MPVQENSTRRYKKNSKTKKTVDTIAEPDIQEETKQPLQKQNSIYTKIAQIKKCGVTYDAREMNAKYVVVNNPSTLRGIWRIAGKSNTQLTDCFIEILRVVKPLPTSNSRDFTIFIRFTNPRGETLDHTVSRQGIDEDTLDAQFVKFGRLPEKDIQKKYLIEAIKEIVRESTALVQMQADALGWYLHDGNLVWLLTNGVETVSKFLTEDLAPFIAPTFTSPGNGYYGCIVSQPTDHIMHLLMEALLPGGSTLIASLVGIVTRIIIPVLTDDIPGITPGMLRFCTEIIGPSRHGKSRLLNAVLSFFGTKFEYDRGSLLNEHGGSDSKIGRLQLTSMMRYIAFSDFDHKVSPGHSLFDKIHNTRSVTNNIYSDDTGGGVVGTQRGGMRARAKPVGALIRTSNYDHSDYGLRHDEENIEARCCSFIWPKNEISESGYQKADDKISEDLEGEREQIYTWGVAYRQWYMHMHMEDIISLVEKKCHEVRAIVQPYISENGTWGCDLHRNQTIDIVLGLFMWLQFLRDTYPSSFMIEWIEQHIEDVIKERLERCLYIHTTAGKFTEENKLVDFILQTIRYMFVSQQWYVTTQQHELLTPKDTTYTLDIFGYRRVIKPGSKDNYESGKTEIAHLIHHKEHGECIAFNTLLFYDGIIREAERVRYTLPDKDTLIEQLVDTNVVLQYHDKQRNKHTASYPVKVSNKTDRFTLTRVNAIYPQNDKDDIEYDEDIQEPERHNDNKIVQFATTKGSIEDLLSNM